MSNTTEEMSMPELSDSLTTEDAMIKLSDLKVARSKMEPGPYTHDPCSPPAGTVNIRGSRCPCYDPKVQP